MKQRSGFVWLVSALAICLADGSSVAQAQANVVPVPAEARTFLDPVQMIVRAAPASALRRLEEDPVDPDAMRELNRYFGQNVTNRSIVLHTTIEAAEAQPDVRNGFRIRAASVPLEWDGGTMKRLSWLYFQAAEAAAANSVKVGSEITVVGWVRRCEVVPTPEGLRLNFDLQYTKIEASSMPLAGQENVSPRPDRRFSQFGPRPFSPPPLAPVEMAGTWTWDAYDKIYPGTIDFENDGTGSHGARNNTTWKKTGEREITITHATRGTAVIHIEADGQSFNGTDYYGKRVSGRRLQLTKS